MLISQTCLRLTASLVAIATALCCSMSATACDCNKKSIQDVSRIDAEKSILNTQAGGSSPTVMPIRRDFPTPRELAAGAELAVVQLQGYVHGMGETAPVARDGLYVLVAFGSRDKLQMVLIELDGTDFVMLPTELVNAGTPGPVQSWGIGASCGDVIPNDDGSLTRTCCVAVANSNGFVAVGCITTTHTIGD